MKRNHQLDRRLFLRASTAAVAAGLTHSQALAKKQSATGGTARKVIILGFDGMDPLLVEEMMGANQLPNFDRLRQAGGYRRLGTSIPPQTPVAFANFIIGANPGQHGIYDFIHRDPARPNIPMFSAAGTSRGAGYWEVGEHKLQMAFWPFGHEPPQPILYRHGVPFWDYLDQAGIATWIYEMPSNYPPKAGSGHRHRAIAGMGTPDMLGTYGTFQHFSNNGPSSPHNEGGGYRVGIQFKNDRAETKLIGPPNTFLKRPRPTSIPFVIYRDCQAEAAMIEIQGQRILLKQGQWSEWTRVRFTFTLPSFVPDHHTTGICRFYLQEVTPTFRLYVTPINIDPTNPAQPVSQPPQFVEQVADKIGLFYTTGFQEDHKALSNGVFTDEEYAAQADLVMEERLKLLRFAFEHFRDGVLFFYFACTDLLPHMYLWGKPDPHPTRSSEEAERWHEHVKNLYRRMDAVVGEVLERYENEALVMVMSDHGMAPFKRQFNLCTWLRENGYIAPDDCHSLLTEVDWSRTRAYGLGLNGLYLNLRNREQYGIVEPGMESNNLLAELTEKLLVPFSVGQFCGQAA